MRYLLMLESEQRVLVLCDSDEGLMGGCGYYV